MKLLQQGQKLKGIYKVERFLGEGAFAEVYRIRHRFLGRQAMKVFKRIGLTVEETEEMLGEAILLSQIGHPNIVRVFNADVVDTSQGLCGFFTMEYVAGGTLEHYWRSFGTKFMPVDQAIAIIKQVCQGLSVAHSKNPPIIHRDIKPQNILVGYDTNGIRVRLSDFGLAKRVNPMTLIASAQGTLAFKAPEFLDEMDSTATDVWAIGTTLYLLVTDRLPYPDLGEDDFISGKRWQRPIILPSRLNIEVDQALESIVLKALAFKINDRYQNAIDLLADLTCCSKTEPIDNKYLSSSSTSSKQALGKKTPADLKEAEKMIEIALQLSQKPGKLMEAADILEEAVNAAPELRERYEYCISLWRQGVTM